MLLPLRLLGSSPVSSLVQLLVAEIQPNVNRDFNEVQHIEEEAQEEQEAFAASIQLNKLSCNTASITDQQEYLEKQALALGGTGNDGLTD